MFFLSTGSTKLKPPQVPPRPPASPGRERQYYLSLHAECICFFNIFTLVNLWKAQNLHCPISMLLCFCISVYCCSPISGPHGRTSWSQFKWSSYSSVLRPKTNGCSRSLVSVYSHEKKNVSLRFWELCALLCMLVLVSVQSLQSTCKAHLVCRFRWKVHF